MTVKLINAQIHVRAASKGGGKNAGVPLVPPIILAHETISTKTLSSTPKMVAWVNVLVLRAIANSGLDAVANVFGSSVGAARTRRVSLRFERHITLLVFEKPAFHRARVLSENFRALERERERRRAH